MQYVLSFLVMHLSSFKSHLGNRVKKVIRISSEYLFFYSEIIVISIYCIICTHVVKYIIEIKV